MNVVDLQKQIMALSHQEDSHSTQLKQKSLLWINHAYQELLDEVLPFATEQRQVKASLTTNTEGAIALPNDCYQVTDLFIAGKKIEALNSQKSIFEQNVTIGYWLEGKQIHLYPKQVYNIDLFYEKYIPELTESSVESDILIPQNFHYALVWGALVWATVQERGFSAKSDLNLFQQKWVEAKQSIKLSLAGKSRIRLKVEKQSDL